MLLNTTGHKPGAHDEGRRTGGVSTSLKNLGVSGSRWKHPVIRPRPRVTCDKWTSVSKAEGGGGKLVLVSSSFLVSCSFDSSFFFPNSALNSALDFSLSLVNSN